MLEVKNISKTYPGEDFGALKGVSLSVKENQVLALVGKSGSGKSTMLQIIAGLMKPDEGEVIFKGEPLDDPNEQLIAGHPKIKVVFQDFQLKPNMTVEENIKYKLLQFDNAYQAERTAELLALCNLSDLAKRKPRELSGGQKQRVSIARALADDPELLLMDEPFSNLDPLTKEELLIELVDIVRAEGLGLVFVTHETKDALLVANQVAFLSDGRMIQNDTTEKVYNQPNTLEIGQFFGRINDLSLITNKPNTFVRAEHIHLGNHSDRAINTLIRRSIFMGAFYMHEASEKHTDSRLFFYSTDILAVNSEVIVCFDSQKILSF